MSDSAANKRHFGVSLWRDLYEPQHWVVVIFGRWLFHVYGWGRPYKQHFYWVPTPSYWKHLNAEDFPEFRRVPV